MTDSITPNLGLTLPTVFPGDQWGGKLNANFSAIDLNAGVVTAEFTANTAQFTANAAKNLATVAALLADTTLAYVAGADKVVVATSEIVEAGGFRYQVAASGASDQHVTTAGGVKLYVQPGASGYNVKAFGAKGDGATDDTTAFLTARNAAYTATATVFIPCGSYVVSGTIGLQNYSGNPAIGTFDGVCIQGAGSEEAIILHKPATADSVLFSMIGGSGTNTNKGVRGLTIKPFDASYIGMGVGILIDGQCFAQNADIVISSQNIGLHLHNKTVGAFTEFNRFNRFRFIENSKDIAFERTGGSASFHGNEFDQVQVNIKSGGFGLHITGTSQAFLYNCRMNIAFFGGAGTRTAIYADNCNTDHNWGNLTCEDTCYLQATATGQFHFAGRFENLGATNYTAVSDGQFIFDNTRNGSAFGNSNISSFAPKPLPSSTVDRDGNGDFPSVFMVSGANMDSVAVATYDFSGNGLFVGGIPLNGDMENFAPGFLLHRNGFTLESFIPETTGFKIDVGSKSYDRRISNGSGIYAVEPNADDDLYLGRSGNRWKQLFAVTGTISTSDEREKQDVGAIPDEWLDAWSDVDFVRYRWKTSVAGKGDGARWHVGVIAQRVKDAFEARGIDPFAAGILCYDEWGSETDEAGNITRKAGNRYGVRYDEALVLEAALTRRVLSALKQTSQ